MFAADSMSGRLGLLAARLSGLDRRVEQEFGGCGAILSLVDETGLRAAPNKSGLEGLAILVESLRDSGFEFVSMDAAVTRLSGETPGKRFLVLTADLSAFSKSAELPDLLEKHGLPMTLYVSPGVISGQADPWRSIVAAAVNSGRRIRMETEQGAIVLDTGSRSARMRAFEALIAWLSTDVPELSVRDAVRRLAMESGVEADVLRRARLPGWETIRALSVNPEITIGASSMRNLRLSRLTGNAVRAEITDALAALALETGLTPHHFALPVGDAWPDAQPTGMAHGLRSVLTGKHAMLHADSDPLALPRMPVSLGDLDAQRLRTRLTGIGEAMRTKLRLK